MANTLLEDAIAYLTDNIRQAGEAFKASNERDRALIQSYRSGGEVDPQQRQGMLEEYIGHASPMTAIGGMIKPSTWAKYTPEAKATVTEVANRSPQKFQEVLQHPDDLMVEVTKNLPNNILGRYRSGHPINAVMDAPAKIHLRPGAYTRTSRIPEHELTHYLNDQEGSRFYKTDVDDAWTIGRLLQSKLPHESRGSLDRIIRESTTELPIQEPPGKLKLGWDKIAGWFGENPDARPLRRDMGPNTYRMSGYQAMDEGLAHLADAAARKDASPEIRKLAREMGVSWEDKTREVLWGGKGGPKWNPRDVPMPPRAVAPTVDIPRGTVSPDALEAFNRLKRERGLDATFGKFSGPTTRKGSEVMREIQKKTEQDPILLAERGLQTAGSISELREIMGGVGMLGGGKKLPVDDFKAVLQTLDKYGLLKWPNLAKEARDQVGQPTPAAVKDDPKFLARLKRFIEETKD